MSVLLRDRQECLSSSAGSPIRIKSSVVSSWRSSRAARRARISSSHVRSGMFQ